jgi:hypothetical protein
MLGGIKRLVFWLTLVLAAAAVVDQLRRPPEERTWHGEVFGVVPYDFRPPSLRRFLSAWWNPDDPRVFTPRDFGVGWAVNLPRLVQVVTGPAKRNGDG